MKSLIPCLSLLLCSTAALAGGHKCPPASSLPNIPDGIVSAVGSAVTGGKPAGMTASAAPAAAMPDAGGDGNLKRRLNELEDIVHKQNQLIELQNKRINELEKRR